MGSNEAIVYDEFEPFCKWQRNQHEDVVEIHLQDFKKEQLKVQLSNHGVLKVSGHRSIDASNHTKFYKEISLPINKYDTQSIHAKFVNSNLIITLPKLQIPAPKTNDEMPQLEPPKTDKTGSTTEAANANDGAKEGVQKQTQTQTPKENALTRDQLECKTRRLTTNAAVSLATTVAMVAVLVAYVMYMYRANSGIDG